MPEKNSVPLTGIYALQQWNLGGQLFAPPQIDGRFVMGEGAIIAVLQNRIDLAAHSSATFFGSYRLDANSFAYGYDSASMTTATPAGPVCSEQLPWQGMREFTVAAEGDCVRIVSLAGTEEFVFSGGGFTYAEHGVLMRRWVRIRAEGGGQ